MIPLNIKLPKKRTMIMAVVICMTCVYALLGIFVFGGAVFIVRGKPLDQIVNVGSVLIAIQFVFYLVLNYIKGLPNGQEDQTSI